MCNSMWEVDGSLGLEDRGMTGAGSRKQIVEKSIIALEVVINGIVSKC